MPEYSRIRYLLFLRFHDTKTGKSLVFPSALYTITQQQLHEKNRKATNIKIIMMKTLFTIHTKIIEQFLRLRSMASTRVPVTVEMMFSFNKFSSLHLFIILLI